MRIIFRREKIIMSEPLVTVLMTVYNGGGYLRPAVESVLTQTYKDFELLIVEDASSDDSLKIIKSYQDPRIRIYSNPRNLGQTKSLNVGLTFAAGKYIARMDADDLAFPTWLAELSAFYERNPEAAVVSAKAAVINGSHQIVRILNTPTQWPQMILKSLTFSPINHVGSLMRKDVVLKMGGYNEQYHVPADFHLWSRLIQQGYRLCLVPKVLVAIRFHEENQSKERNQEEMVRIICDNVQHLTSYPIEEREAALLYRLIYDISSLDYQDFKEALAILESVYRQIKPSLGVEAFVEKTLAEQKKIAAMKKIFVSIEKGDLHEIRLLSRDYMNRRRWCSIFFLVWLISLSGTMALRFLPRIYNGLQRLKMQWTLRSKATLQWIR